MQVQWGNCDRNQDFYRWRLAPHDAMDAIAAGHQATPLWQRLVAEIGQLMAARGAHPARTVVLLPYAQLMPVATRAWAADAPAGFAPRFETTMNWAGALPFEPGDDDISFDMARDLLTARAWLDRAGLAAQADLLAGRLVEATWQLAGAAAAVAPQDRPQWTRQARSVVVQGVDAAMLALEAAVARIALEWAAASTYATDALFQPAQWQALELLVVAQGFQAEPLAAALARQMGDRAVTLALDRPADAGNVLLHAAQDPAHEADAAAACVLRHIDAGRVPVALAAIDRVLTRRVRAMLDARGVALRDETGWKLSTTRAAAQVVGALRACAWNAGSDAVIDWLKNAPACAPHAVSALERRVRREGLRDWRSIEAQAQQAGAGAWQLLVDQANAWRADLQAVRPLHAWLAALHRLLLACGHAPRLAHDAAGAQLLDALGLHESAAAGWQRWPHAAHRFSLADFTGWVQDVLEAASFKPASAPQEQVVILPFNQLLARDFPAVVRAGCDEQRLPASPEPPGPWNAAQRVALGLPTRAALEAEVRAGWRHALQAAHCDVLWRTSDDSGEPVLASALVHHLQLHGTAQPGADPLEARTLAPQPALPPLPTGQALPLVQLSASAYEDLRRCPYRFFALRQLGLQQADEIDADLDKRDFGNWLHKVLGTFHDVLARTWEPPGAARAALLDLTAQEVTRVQRLDEGEFMPFAAAWPQVRDGYLQWLQDHEATGATFVQAEGEYEMPLGLLKLVGRIDRIDRLADGAALVMDYKTEAQAATKSRLAQPTEDTQLAFYAALLQDDTLQAAYVNVGERGETKTLAQPAVVPARDALVQGILDDFAAISAGAALPALGEGTVCDFCSARGLCRKDFWT